MEQQFDPDRWMQVSDLASAEHAIAEAFFLAQCERSPEALWFLKLAEVHECMEQSFQALDDLERAYGRDPGQRRVVEAGEAFPLLADLVQSEAYRDRFAAPVQPMAADLDLAGQEAGDAPWRVYLRLEAAKDSGGDLVELLGIQLYCIAIIASDIDEHGEGNCLLYGRELPQDLLGLRSRLAHELKERMAMEGRTEVSFWKREAWNPGWF